MEKITIVFECDPTNYTHEHVTMMKDALEKSFCVKDHSYIRFAETPPSFVTFALGVITTLLITDLYKWTKGHVKRFVKGFVNPKAGDVPRLSVLFEYRSLTFCAEIKTNDDGIVSEFLNKLPDLLERAMTLIEKVEISSKEKRVTFNFDEKSKSFDLTPLMRILEKK
jgi:hypothetical protein